MLLTRPRTVLVIVAFLSIVPAFANLKKAFEALEQHNYFLARDLFLKNTRKQPEAAWYGLSVISGRENNPFHDLDSAHVFIMRSDAAFTLADDKRRRQLTRFGVDHAAIEAQKTHVFERAWEIARTADNITAYDRYINTFSTSAWLREAIQLRDQLAFQQAREEDTATAYTAFLERYPHAREVYEARNRLQEAIYRENTQEDDIESYITFMQRFPESPYVRNAEDEIYRLSTRDRTIAQYQEFIRRHPTNHRVPDAWRRTYEIYTLDLSVNAITRFLTEFPDYPFVEELVHDYRTASLRLLPFRQDGRWGFIDDEGVERIEPEFDWVEHFEGAQALVSRNGKVGTINRSGREVIPIRFDEVLDPVESISTVELDGLMGAVDRGGELVVPLEFADVGEFSQGHAYAAKDSLYGYINNRGGVVIPFQFISAGTFRNGLAVVETDDGFGVIDNRGNIVVPTKYDWVEGFDKEVSRVRLDGSMGLISPFGDEMMPAKYKHIGPFNEGLALVVDGRKSGYADMTGRMVIPFQYEAAEGVVNWGDLQNGLAEVQQGGKRCLINAKDQKVMPCQFADIGRTTGAIIPFRKRTKWGYAQRNGTILFDNRYDQAWEMVDGLARVKNGHHFGAIDSTGREVIALNYFELSDPVHGMVVATGAQGSGILDVQGRELLPLMYHEVVIENERVAKVALNKRFAYVRIADGGLIWKEQGFNVPGQTTGQPDDELQEGSAE